MALLRPPKQVADAQPGEQQIRILICKVCRTLEEIPFKDPNDGAPDPYLEAYVQLHRRKGGHDGEDVVLGPMVVVKRQWEQMGLRKKILEDLKKRTVGTQIGGDYGIDLELYASHNTFKVDAMKCYNRHGRPIDGCSDYCDSSKLLGRPTQEGRAAFKEMPKLAVETGPYLCWHCPVQTYVTTTLRARRGAYKE